MSPSPTFENRRTRRSADLMTALHYQLAYARSEGELEALVLVDGAGCLVAGAGAWPTCEELAAYAPLLAHRDAAPNDTVASRVGVVAEDVEVRSMAVHDEEVILCARGGGARKIASIARAAAGCRRILGGEA